MLDDIFEFSARGYQALITGFKDRGYRVVGYEAIQPLQQHIVLRHDIDMSIEAAVRTAYIEADLDVSAYYFVLLRSELYNPYSESNRNSLRNILALGHKIGLHLDASMYTSDWSGLEAAAKEECAILESIIQEKVDLISFHRPHQNLLGNAQSLAGRMHTYQPRFFQEIGYCSDSRGGWHHGHPFDHDAVKGKKAIQLLTHPIWWDGEAVPATDRLSKFVDIAAMQFKNSLAVNCETYREIHSLETIAKKY